MNQATADIASIFLVIGLGLAMGKLSWRGMSLGTSGVIFIALLAGHFGFRMPEQVGTAGVVLFVYCLGIGAGPAFARMFFQRGKLLAVMAGGMILSAGIVAWAAAAVLDLSPALTGGLLAGALTSTPALAAAADQLPDSTDVAIGFGIAYPFGVIGVILFVQLIPALFPKTETSADSSPDEDTGDEIIRAVLVVANPGIIGRRLNDVSAISSANCQVSRLLVDDQLLPIPADFTLQAGQRVLVIGARKQLPKVVEVLGERCEEADYVLDVVRHQRRVVVTSSSVTGKTLEQLHLRSTYGITVSRICRQDVEFVPGPRERILFGDALTVVGGSEELTEFARVAGHRERVLEETDLISLAIGLVLGMLLGQFRLTFGDSSISLGLAGGPLVVGLLLGHLGHLGPLTVRMPRAARLLLADVGLVLFLGQVGAQAGGQIFGVLASYGWALPVAALVIVSVPLAVGLLLGRYCFHLRMLETTGGICGAMTSTPGLGVVTSGVDSSLPATSYAAVYPLALIAITILAPLLITQLS